jgi:hypothetical protein
MTPFEALYGRKCRTPLNWIEPGERRYYGIDFIEEAEKKVHIIQQNMKQPNHVRKAMQIRGDCLCLKLVTMCI